MASDRKPLDERLDEIEATLGPEERPTAARLRRIEQTAEPVSYPPGSSVGRRWTPAGVVLVITAFGGLMSGLGVALAPLVNKPDYSGWVKEERLTACEVKLDARSEAHEKALEGERARVTRCYDRLGACQSQQGAAQQVIESMGTKKRR